MSVHVEHPVATCLQQLESARTPLERLHRALLTAETLMHVDALLVFDAALQSAVYVDAKVRSAALRDSPSMGAWHQLLQAMAGLDVHGEAVAILDWFLGFERGGSQALARLVAIRNESSHAAYRTDEVHVLAWEEETVGLLRAALDDHPELGGFVALEDGLVQRSTGGLTSLSPLFRSGAQGGLLLMSAYKPPTLRFSGLSGEREDCHQACAWLQHRLRMLVGTMDQVQVADDPALVRRRLKAHSEETLGRLIELKRYRPDESIDRAEADAFLRALEMGDARVMVASGPQGAGKTTWACRVVARVLEAGGHALLETADRLSSDALPDALAQCVRIGGDLGTALHHAARQDELTWVVVDDLGAGGRDEDLLMSALRWMEALGPSNAVRCVLTLRSERLGAILARRAAALPARLVKFHELAPLSHLELTMLASRLPLPPGSLAATISDARTSLVSRLAADPSASARRPGVARLAIEAADADPSAPWLSTVAACERVFEADVLCIQDGQSARPRRARVARALAWQLARQDRHVLSLEEKAAETTGLLDPTSGTRTPECDDLISMGYLVEALEELTPLVGFAEPRAMQLAAASSLLQSGPLVDAVRRLREDVRRRDVAAAIGAFVLARLVREGGAGIGAGEWVALGSETEPMLVELALIDPRAFLEALERGLQTRGLNPDACIAVVESLMRVSESNVAARAMRILLRLTPSEGDTWHRARWLLIRALYEADEYDEALREIASWSGALDPAVGAWRADIEISRGDFDAAAVSCRRLLEDVGEDHPARGTILRQLGVALDHLGALAEARVMLDASVATCAAARDVRGQAEALADLGELHLRQGDAALGRLKIEQSAALNLAHGSLVGMGIVAGLLAECDMADLDLDRADLRLCDALRIHRLVGNRWREAWTLRRQARLAEMRGRLDEAEALEDKGCALFRTIGAAPQ